MVDSSRLRNRARAHPRYPVVMRVTRYGGTPGEWSTVNLSEGGMFVEAVAPMVLGSLVEVGIFIDGTAAPVSCTAQVMWRNDPDDSVFDPDLPSGMGMKFIDPPPATEKAVRDFLAELDNPEDVAIAEITVRSGSGSGTPTTNEGQTLLLATGTILGSYRILGILGQGGMGTVYLAEHIRLGREVAIKRLHPKFTHDATAAKRFFDEARLVNQIEHEHITEITDFITEGTDHYFVMELLDGTSLGEVLAQHGKLPLARAIHIGLQLCDVLEAVHDQNIIHRDLKPENILLIHRGDDLDFVKLVDFGIAKLRESAGSTKRATAAGTVVGTPGYIAPELILGDVLDHRIDVYGFGVVFYQMVVGHLPFEADGFDQLLVKQATELPPRPKEELALPVPPEVEDLILSCLDSEPDNRPGSMAEVAEVLREVERALWATDGPSSLFEIAVATAPQRPRRRWPLVLAAVVLVAAGAGVALDLTGWLGETRLLALTEVTKGEPKPSRPQPTVAVAAKPTAEPEPAPEPEPEPELKPGPKPEHEVTEVSEPVYEPVYEKKKKRKKKRRGRKSAEAEAPREGSDGPYERGVALLRERKALLAVAELEAAVAAKPRHAEAHRALGQAYVLLGRNDAAVASFERYLRLKPKAKDAARLQTVIDTLRGG